MCNPFQKYHLKMSYRHASDCHFGLWRSSFGADSHSFAWPSFQPFLSLFRMEMALRSHRYVLVFIDRKWFEKVKHVNGSLTAIQVVHQPHLNKVIFGFSDTQNWLLPLKLKLNFTFIIPYISLSLYSSKAHFTPPNMDALFCYQCLRATAPILSSCSFCF